MHLNHEDSVLILVCPIMGLQKTKFSKSKFLVYGFNPIGYGGFDQQLGKGVFSTPKLFQLIGTFFGFFEQLLTNI